MDATTLILGILAVLTLGVGFFTRILQLRLTSLRIRLESETKDIREKQKRILEELSDFSGRLTREFAKLIPTLTHPFHGGSIDYVTPGTNSLFDIRCSHFTPEKECLAGFVVSKLLRLLDPTDEGDPKLAVILVLDSGSTVFPVFRQLCTHPSFQFNRSNADRVKIVTNNLPGVSELTRWGRVGAPNRAKTLFECRILSGFAHSQYEASLSKETAVDLKSAVQEFRKDISGISGITEIRILSAITGNYVSIDEGVLARDPNHVATKEAMIDVADEVLVLAPLGKFLPYSCVDINSLLGLHSKTEQYSKLANWSGAASKLRITVTTRKAYYWKKLQPDKFMSYLNGVQEQLTRNVPAARLVPLPFDPSEDTAVRIQASIAGEPTALREYELPHRNMRESLLESLP